MTEDQLKTITEKVNKQVQEQRAIANYNLAEICKKSTPEQLQDAMFQIEIYCTHMLTLIYFNKIAAGKTDTKQSYDRARTNLTNELTWLSEQELNLMPAKS